MSLRPAKRMGHLQLIFGPMYSGKTSELIRRVKRYSLCSYKCIVIKYAKDTRYSLESAATHDGIEVSAVSALKLDDIADDVANHDVIGIDEGQFFPDVVDFCKKKLKEGKILIVAGLDATFKKTPFENMINLVPLAHSVEKLSGVCMSCGGKASFTKRTCNQTEIEVIGGLDSYIAVCRRCYDCPTPQKRPALKSLTPRHLNLKSELVVPHNPTKLVF